MYVFVPGCFSLERAPNRRCTAKTTSDERSEQPLGFAGVGLEKIKQPIEITTKGRNEGGSPLLQCESDVDASEAILFRLFLFLAFAHRFAHRLRAPTALPAFRLVQQMVSQQSRKVTHRTPARIDNQQVVLVARRIALHFVEHGGEPVADHRHFVPLAAFDDIDHRIVQLVATRVAALWQNPFVRFVALFHQLLATMRERISKYEKSLPDQQTRALCALCRSN